MIPFYSLTHVCSCGYVYSLTSTHPLTSTQAPGCSTTTILSFDGAFHGRTFGALATTLTLTLTLTPNPNP